MRLLRFFQFSLLFVFLLSVGALEAQDKKYITYKVKEGETIESIAKSLSVTPYDLLKLNRLPLRHWRLITRRPMVSMRVRSRFVVVLDKFANQVIEMILAEGNEMVEAFRLDGLNETFDTSVEIG